MQDVLLEPYGGEVLGLSVAGTTVLTALWAAGALAGFALAARGLTTGRDPHRLAAYGMVIGVFAFAAVILSDPTGSPFLFRIGAVLIGMGGGLFAVGTLTAAMELGQSGGGGLALGAWGAVQATADRLAIAVGGASATLSSRRWPTRRAGPRDHRPVGRLQRRLPHRNRFFFSPLVVIGPLVPARRPRAATQVPEVRPGRVPRLGILNGGNPWPTGAITSHIDVAQVVLYAFWIFFAGLIFYLRREDRREGYPLEYEVTGQHRRSGGLDAATEGVPPAAWRHRHGAQWPPRP